MIDAIADYMRGNVAVDPELEFTNYLSFKAELSGNDVYIGITPSPLLKQFVKDDSSIGTIGEVEALPAAAYSSTYVGTMANYNYAIDQSRPTPANCPVYYASARYFA